MMDVEVKHFVLIQIVINIYVEKTELNVNI